MVGPPVIFEEVSAMPANRIRVTWDEQDGYRCRVWDKNGVPTDVTDIFEAVSGATGVGRIYTQIALMKDSMDTKIGFRALSKRLVFDVPEDVIAQILQLQQG